MYFVCEIQTSGPHTLLAYMFVVITNTDGYFEEGSVVYAQS